MGAATAWMAIAMVGSALISASAQKRAAREAAEAAEAAAAAQEGSYEMGMEYQLEAAEKAAEAQKYAADVAAKAQIESVEKSIEAQMDMYNKARADVLPWAEAGQRALGTLEQKIQAGPGEFTESPGYQFRLDQGKKTLLSSAAATQSLASGRTLKALEEYGQDYASNEYDKFLNRYYQSLVPLQEMAKMGQNAAAMTSTQSMQTGASIANLQQGLGQGLSDIFMSEGRGLSDIYQNQGLAAASGYANIGNIRANLAMNLGNIKAGQTVAQANAWGSALQGLGTLAGSYYGSQPSSGSAGYSGAAYMPSNLNQGYYHPQQQPRTVNPKWV